MMLTRTHATKRSLFALLLRMSLFSLPLAAFAQAPEPLVLRGAAWEAGFDRRTGRLLFVRSRQNGGAPAQTLAATPPEGSLWQITFRDGRTLRAADFAGEREGAPSGNVRTVPHQTALHPAMSAQSGTMRPEWLADGALRLTYGAKAATVVVEAVPGGDYLDLRLRVTAADGEILTAALPADLHLAASLQPSPSERGVSGRPDTFPAPAPLRRLLFPADLGLALKPGFFQPQSDPARWERTPLGPAGLARVAPNLRIAIPADEAGRSGVEDMSAELTVTEMGRALLGDALARQWGATPAGAALRRRALVNRPAQPPPALPILASPRGIWFGGHAIGRGLLLRFAGPVKIADSSLVIPTVAQTLAGLRRASPLPSFRPAPARRRVVLLALRRGPASGGWAEVPVEYWRRRLPAWEALRAAGLETATAETAAQTLEALRDPATFAVVNPYGEGFPTGATDACACSASAGSESAHHPPARLSESAHRHLSARLAALSVHSGEGRWEETADAVRRFLEAGGVWVETGGYPFFFALTPVRFHALETNYPGGFSDFAAIETEMGAVGLYGVQDARDPKTILVPSLWRVYADPRGGHLARAWRTLVRRGETWQAPPVRLRLGADAATMLESYALDNNLRQPLAQTVPLALLERWKRALLIAWVGGTCAEQTRALERLPPGALIHLVDFLRGGFDKQYPDLLPPNPAYGTPEEFRALLDRAHALGHLIMPYTNHTWWCDEPKGPTFLASGDAPLLRRLDGRPAREDYAGNWGWSVCPWHPAVIAAAERIVEQFTREYPADILFQDQVGARGSIWYDLNPAAPTPWAYHQGFLNLAKRAAPRVPLATENGYDRLIGAVAQFCGNTWPLVPYEETPPWLATWLRYYRQQFAPDDWELYPMAHRVAADGALFSIHLGGPFVTAREPLLWSLALGMQMLALTSPSAVESAYVRSRLLCLDRVQKAVSARCMGTPLTAFRYRKGSGPNGVIESVFGDTRVLVNLTAEPYPVDEAEIAPMGFYVCAPGLEAGLLSAYGGRRHPEGLWLFREQDGKTARVTVCANAPVEVSVPLEEASRWRVVVRSRPAHQTAHQTPPERAIGVEGRRILLRLAPAGEDGADIPEEWRRVAPLERAQPPKYLGVLRLEPEEEGHYLWAAARAADWQRALEDCAPVRAGRLEVRPIRSVEDLRAALERPEEWFGIVNPYGERIPAPEASGVRAVAEAIGRYVRRGGLWFETGGYPFFSALLPQGAPSGATMSVHRSGRWEAATIGPGPLYASGLSGCHIRPEDEFPARLEPTETGMQWLGAAWANAIRGQAVVANRPPREEDYEVALARTAGGVPFVTGHQLGGAGWLFRLAGRETPPAVALSTVAGLIEALAQRPPLLLPPKTAPQLCTAELQKE